MTTLRTLPLGEYPARRIALIKPSALGDIVHSLPVLAALRQRYPEAHIAWVVNRSFEPLLAGHPDLDETIVFERNALRAGLMNSVLMTMRFLSRLRRRRFDLVIDLQGLLRTGLMALASGATRRVGLASAREGAVRAYTDVVSDAGHSHAVDRYWTVAEALGTTHKTIRFQVPVAPAAAQWALAQLDGAPRPWLMLGVGARWQTKRWPTTHFAALLQQAQQRFGGTAVLVGGPDETMLAHDTARRLRGPVRNLTGRTTLPQLVAVLQLADVMIANDTGPLHLAAALGRPVVAPFTCTQVRLTGPYGQPASAVETQVWCRGSLRKTCDRLECMSELTPARLWPLVEEVLATWQSKHRCA
jgi:lipopolysaccharide heptosyltransferase I